MNVTPVVTGERIVGDGAVRVAVQTLGCKVNQVESEELAARFMGSGCLLSPEDEAEVVVVNTCTVTAEADAKARKLVRHALRAPREPVVVVTGCLAAVDAGSLEGLSERVIVEPDKSRVAERVAAALGIDVASGESAPRGGSGFRTRAMLKIQDGCDSRCSYCIVPQARGGPRSVPLDDLLAETERLLEAGAKEIVLTGINLGRYDDAGTDLAALIAAVSATGAPRLRLSSIEPVHLTDDVLATLATSPALCHHLHVPLQSGSDAVLEAMGRRYDIAGFGQRIAAARDALPGLAVTTDVIAGFPSEREEDAQRTLAVCEEIGFARLHVFRYSARVGTPAAGLSDQVPAQARSRRAAALRSLDRSLRARHAASRRGGLADVLLERLDGPDESGQRRAVGTSEDYLKVRFGATDQVVGDLVRVRLAEQGPDGFLRGVPESGPGGYQVVE